MIFLRTVLLAATVILIIFFFFFSGCEASVEKSISENNGREYYYSADEECISCQTIKIQSKEANIDDIQIKITERLARIEEKLKKD